MNATDTQPAVAELLEQWWPWVQCLARRHAFYARTDRADLAQEIALAAIRYFHHYDPAKGAYSHWLVMIAAATAGKCREKALALKRQVVVCVGDTLDVMAATHDADQAADLDRTALIHRLRGSFRTLTPRERLAVRRRFGIGGAECTFREIDPGKHEESNRHAVEMALWKLRECLSHPRGTRLHKRPPSWRRNKPLSGICRHCSTCKVNRPRGLCWGCYYTPGVKELYPPSKYAPRAVHGKPLTMFVQS